MKKKKKNKLIILIILVIIALVTFAVYQLRSPVLIITEQSFVGLYGEKRLQNQSLRLSISLFRPVKAVIIANDAGDDIVPYAITEVSTRPFCVIFPYRFIRSADLYRDLNPNARIVILQGRYSGRRSAEVIQSGYFVYKTDIESDFYRAGLAAAAIVEENNGSIAVIIEPRQNSSFGAQAREAFLKAVNERENPLTVSFFTSLSSSFDNAGHSCVVMAGTGNDFFDRKTGTPVIMFSWLDPLIVPYDVVLVIDDSPWAQARQVVNLVSSGEKEGVLKSKFAVTNSINIDKGILRKIRKIQ